MAYSCPELYRPERWSLTDAEPDAEPVLLAELKDHLRITHGDEDQYLMGLIAAARQMAEAETHRAFIQRARTFKMDLFPVSDLALIELPGGAVQSVTSIQYLDGDGVSQTWDSANYILDAGWVPARIGLAYQATWPIIREWDLPITITYEVGYGATAADVPWLIAEAVKRIAAELYERRENSVVGASVADVSFPAWRLLSPYRILRLP